MKDSLPGKCALARRKTRLFQDSPSVNFRLPDLDRGLGLFFGK